MKTFFCLAACILTALPALADNTPSFRIESRFESFDPALFRWSNPVGASEHPFSNAGSAPQVTTKAGQQATIEIIREIVVPGGLQGKEKVNSGVILEVLPKYEGGKITLTGHAMIRHHLEPGDKQPLDAVSFSTRETYFSGEVTDGKPLNIRVGEGLQDKSCIVLTVRQVAAKIVDGEEKHTAPPKYRVYAIDPSPEMAKNQFFRIFDAPSMRGEPFSVAGVFGPEGESPSQDQFRQLVNASLKEIPTDKVPVKVSSTLYPDGQTLDIKLQSADGAERKLDTSVSVLWGSDIFLAVNDPTRPNGRRGLLLRQE